MRPKPSDLIRGMVEGAATGTTSDAIFDPDPEARQGAAAQPDAARAGALGAAAAQPAGDYGDRDYGDSALNCGADGGEERSVNEREEPHADLAWPQPFAVEKKLATA